MLLIPPATQTSPLGISDISLTQPSLSPVATSRRRRRSHSPQSTSSSGNSVMMICNPPKQLVGVRMPLISSRDAPLWNVPTMYPVPDPDVGPIYVSHVLDMEINEHLRTAFRALQHIPHKPLLQTAHAEGYDYGNITPVDMATVNNQEDATGSTLNTEEIGTTEGSTGGN